MTRLLSLIALSLAVINIAAQAATFYLPDFFMRDWLLVMFDVGREANFPATFSGGLLLCAALILGAIAAHMRQHRKAFRGHWAVLAGTFLFLCIDELASVHDHTIEPIRKILAFDGTLSSAWVIPYGLVVLFFLLNFLRFLLNLPRSTCWYFVLAGGIYVGAALGMELLESYSKFQWQVEWGEQNMLVALMIGVEELGEMLGVVVFIYALLSYIEKHLPGFAVQLRIKSEAGRPDR